MPLACSSNSFTCVPGTKLESFSPTLGLASGSLYPVFLAAQIPHAHSSKAWKRSQCYQVAKLADQVTSHHKYQR